jgi:hypothetical protein
MKLSECTFVQSADYGGSDAYKGGGTQAERRAFWALFWERQAIISEMHVRRNAIADLYAANPLLKVLMQNADPHATDHAAGMRPMSGTYTTERTTRTWPAGSFPRKAMR